MAMGTTRTILDPTSERRVGARELLARPASLAGLRVGLLDISKPRGDVFLDRLEQRLTDIGAEVTRYRSRRSPSRRRSTCVTRSPRSVDVVIEALAD